MNFFYVFGLCFIVTLSSVFSAAVVPNSLDGVFVPYKMKLTVPVSSVIHTMDGASLERLLQNHLNKHPISQPEESGNAAPTVAQPAPEESTAAPVPGGSNPAPEESTPAPGTGGSNPGTGGSNPAPGTGGSNPGTGGANPAPGTGGSNPVPEETTPALGDDGTTSTTFGPIGRPGRKRRGINVENVNESKFVFDPEFEESLRQAKEEVAKTLAESGDENIKAFYLRGTLTVSPLI